MVLGYWGTGLLHDPIGNQYGNINLNSLKNQYGNLNREIDFLTDRIGNQHGDINDNSPEDI